MTQATNTVCFFEIPVADMERAVRFYSAVFGGGFERATVDGNDMAYFPAPTGAGGVGGSLARGDSYAPGRQGVRIYFKTDSIAGTLAKVVAAGGLVVYPETSVGELGSVAEFEDTEGNCIALHADPGGIARVPPGGGVTMSEGRP